MEKRENGGNFQQLYLGVLMATSFTDLEKNLWEAADNLRANSDLKSQEYSTPVLGLIFLKYTCTQILTFMEIL